MSTAPINIFQRLMRKWEAVHPYNAAQVMVIAGKPDREKLEAAWNDALHATGLGRVVVENKRYRFTPTPGLRYTEDPGLRRFSDPASAVTRHLPNPILFTNDQCFSCHVSTELDRAFAPDELPFRPFVIEEGDHFFAGVVYQHWIADSVSIRMLLREWFVRVYDPPAARVKPFRLPRNGYWHTVGPQRSGWDVMGSTLAMIRRHTRLRRAKKVASTALTDHRTRFELFPGPDDLIPRLRAFAKSNGVKLNDIFLAALIEACAEHVPLQRRPSREDVAVGSIVDLRTYSPDDLSDTFGVFLGFTNVVCHPSELKDFSKLLRVVSSQTRVQKETGVAPASLIWMGAAMSIGLLSRPDELYHFYRKELPLAGGISNIDLSQTWAAAYHPRLLRQYIRVSPSGPMTPLVVTTTTLGRTFHLGLTHRVGLIPPELAEAVAGSFLRRIAALS